MSTGKESHNKIRDREGRERERGGREMEGVREREDYGSDQF